MEITYPFDDPHTPAEAEILQSFQTNAETGLSQAEADNRAKKFGANIFEAQKQKSIWLMFLLQFMSPIVYLLVFGALVSLYFKDYIEAIAIGAVILINALIGFFMELQARISMNALKEMDVIHSKVIRDGKIQDIPSEKLVPGDIVMLEAGDVIPADGRLLEANQFRCDESSLTGESLPSEKNTEKLPKDTGLGDQLNMVFKGASVITGKGKAVITGIAKNTQLGTITSLVASSGETTTPLDRKLNVLSKKLIWFTLILIGIFAVTGFIQGEKWVLIIKTSIALAVAAFPEGLPIVATVALAHGMLLMARRNALVKKLSSVETLGSTNVILTDKTGTLTENKIYVDTFSFPEEKLKVRIENNSLKIEKGEMAKVENSFEKLKLIGLLCNDASVKQGDDSKKLSGDPIEIALITLANTSESKAEEIKGQYERIAEAPFSSETKMMGTLHKGPGGQFAAAKGSVEHLLEKCTKIQTGETTGDLSGETKKNILLESEKMAAEGLRVLAFAYREDTGLTKHNFLNDLVYVGMIGFLDPPRMDIKDAIASCRKGGIRIVMITGDHPMTALNIARKVGLVDEGEKNTITGKELPRTDSLTEEWKKKILSTSVFARTTPKQKLDIVEIYQKAGNIVAMTGDGVNDAPALKKADVGIAMGLRGTQVAKETASIILKDDSFTSIAAAVSHGRIIFQNIQKFVVYLVSCNLSEIMIVTLMGFLAPAAVLLPLQILFLNMVTDVFPALALGVGKGDKSVMDRPPRDPKKKIITQKNWLAIGVYAVLMTASVILAVFYCRYTMVTDSRMENNIAFFTLAFAQLFHVFNMSAADSRLFINDVTKNKFVWLALFICFGILAIVFFLPQMRLVLNLGALPLRVWLVSILAGLLPLILVQGFKIIRGKKKKI